MNKILIKNAHVVNEGTPLKKAASFFKFFVILQVVVDAALGSWS